MKTTKTITIEIPEGKRAEWVDGVLTLVDDKPKDITERIQTFEDAYEWCKKNGRYDLIEQYQDALNVGLQRAKDILAYLKLRIIVAALNEGWEPQFTEDECRWYPWFYLYTEEELSRKSNEWKKKNTIIPLDSRLVGRSGSSGVALGGLVYGGAGDASSGSGTSGGSRHTFREKRLAEYAGTQFAQIYADFIFAKD